MLQLFSILEHVVQTGAFTAIIAFVTVYLTQQYRRSQWRSKNLYPSLVEADVKLSQVEPIHIGEYFLMERMSELGDRKKTLDAWKRTYTRLGSSFRTSVSIYKQYAYLLEPRHRELLNKLHDAHEVAAYQLVRQLLTPSDDPNVKVETEMMVGHILLMLSFIKCLKVAVSRRLDYSMP